MVLQRSGRGFCEELSLELLIAECGPVLVREMSFLERPIGDGQGEFPIIGL
jgi:hypothetical protein